MDNLTFDDLKVYAEDLKQEVKREVDHRFELFLIQPELKTPVFAAVIIVLLLNL